MAGYAVLVRSNHNASCLTRFRLADFQLLGDKAVNVCHQDLSTFEAIAHYRRSLPARCYFFHSNDDALLRQLQDTAPWQPSTFDGDSSI